MRHTLFFMLALVLTPSSHAAEVDPTPFLEKLRAHYKHAANFKKYELKYHFSFKAPYQSFDYKKPDSSYAERIAEINMEAKQYHIYTGYRFLGGYSIAYNSFQTGDISRQYNIEGVMMGKRIADLGAGSYERIKSQNNSHIDFLAVTPLLSSTEQDKVIASREPETGHINVSHTNADGKETRYSFSQNPIRLVSVADPARGEKSIFVNYVTKGGITYASQSNEYENGDLVGHFYIDDLKAISGIDPDKFKIPTGYDTVPYEADPALTAEKLSEGTYVLSDAVASRNILVKKGTAGVTVFGAPDGEELSEKVIAFTQQTFPGTPITAVFVSHAHSDHISGLPTYTTLGATILADAYTIEAIKHFTPFKENIEGFKFQTISHREQMRDIRFYVPNNPHVKGQGFVYFNDMKLIYQGDYLVIPADGTIPSHLSDVERGFIDFVRSEGLNINRIIGNHHNSNITLDMMNTYYAKNLD